MTYFLAASRDLPQGASTYLGIGLIESTGLWLAASASFVVVHTLLWTSKPGWQRMARYGLASILMALPPFGITGWAGPVTAAGVMFPGWGWFGLAATATGLLVMTTRNWPIAVLSLGGAWAWSAATWTPPTVPDGWMGINTSFDYSDKVKASGYQQQMDTIVLVRKSAGEGHSVIVLPESAFGAWTPTTERLWTRSLAGIDVIILGGTTVLNGNGYENVIVKITKSDSEIVYRQRMPVLFAMWRPWASGGASADFFGKPVMDLGGQLVAPLICHEQFLVWPVLHSILAGTKVIVATGNVWWTGENHVEDIQRANAQAWAALFNLPLVTGFNSGAAIHP
ncbi:MAG: conjugal transfer protein TraB, partial [Notoacmeibacter sp.]|nr:conjugal transfer protein TraB [Notoacmeibacter sp.]